LLFEKRFHAGLIDGTIRRSYRLWDRAPVRVGRSLHVRQVGLLAVDAVARVPVGEVKDKDARAAGFDSSGELRAYLERVTGRRLTARTSVYRIDFHHAGEDDRDVLARDAAPGKAELAQVVARLDEMDRRRAWTGQALELIARKPGVVASKLAKEVGRELRAFKVDIRKLKALGLTISLEVGYELSPRGRAVLAFRRLRTRSP
jgi:hypothetical protein